jgi:Tfp pilus assembly protein PilE
MKKSEGYTLAETAVVISLLSILVFIVSGFFYTLVKSGERSRVAAGNAFKILHTDSLIRECVAQIHIPYWEKISTSEKQNELKTRLAAINSGANPADPAASVNLEQWGNGVIITYCAGKKEYRCMSPFAFYPVMGEW